MTDVEVRPMQLPRVRWFVALWLWMFGAKSSAHAVFASEPPVRPSEMRKRPGVLWPRVVTMRWVAGELPRGTTYRVPSINRPRRLIAWRERRASLLEVVRHHGAAICREQAPRLSAWVRGRA